MSESKNNSNIFSDYKAEKLNYKFIPIEKIIHDIRNLRSLTPDMILNIENMSQQDKMKIILTYSEIISSVKDLLDNSIV